MKTLVCLLISMLGFASISEAATYYMRPYSTGPYGDSSGSSYANAFRAWNANTLPTWNPGDRLIICGVVGIHPSDVTGFMNMGANAGSDASHIVITGLCPEEAGTLGTLTGAGTLQPVLRVTFSYVDLEDINVTNSSGWVDDYAVNGSNADCVIVSSAGGGPGYNIVSRVRTSECSGVGINVQKGFVIVQDSVVTRIGIDGIIMSSAASGTIIRRNIVSDFSRHNVAGDGIETTTATTGDILIEYNTVTFQNFLSGKSGIIGGGTAPGITTIRFNTVISTDLAQAIALPANGGISWTAGAANIYGNTISGFYGGVLAFNVGVAHTTVNIYNNVLSNNYFGFRFSPTTAGPPTYNFYNNTATNVSYGISDGHTVNMTLNAYNNVITLLNPLTLTPKGYALLTIAGTTYNGNNNDFYPEGTDFIRNAVCGGSLYATLAAYQAACTTQDTVTVAVDPLLTATYRTKGTSTMRRAGVATGFCRDPRDRVCKPDRPDIGAYQASSGDPANTRTAR